MRKFLFVLITLIIVGCAGFWGYQEWSKPKETEAVAGIVTDEEKETETIEQEGAVEIRTGTPVDKKWEFSFSEPLDSKTLTDTAIYITDTEGKRTESSTQLTQEGKTIVISPPKEGYQSGTRYELHVSDQVSYENGKNVDRYFRLDFLTEREEKEEIILNSELKFIEQTDIKASGEQQLELRKRSLDNEVKKGDIFIIPLKKDPQGQAVKVTSVEEGFQSYTVKVEKPEFTEIFEKVDIYKSYPITSNNFMPEEGIEGVSISSIAFNSPENLLVSAGAIPLNKAFEEPQPGMEVKINDGLRISLSNLMLDKKHQLALSGTIRLLKPEVSADIDTRLLEINRMVLKSDFRTETDVTFHRMGKEINLEELAKKHADIDKRINLGDFEIPIGTSGLMIEGNLALQVDLGKEGGIKIITSYDIESSNGLIYEDGKLDPIQTYHPTIDIAVDGNGTGQGKFGMAANVVLTAFNVIGAGVEGFAGPKIEGTAAAGVSTKYGKYACGKLEYGLSAEGSVIVNTVNNIKLAEVVIVEYLIPPNVSIDNCKSFQDFTSVKDIRINSGEPREIEVKGSFLDLLTMKTIEKEVKMKDVEVMVSNQAVAVAEKTEKGIRVTASDNPPAENATISLSMKVDGEEKIIDIPLVIGNFKQLKEEQEKSKLRKTEVERILASKIEGIFGPLDRLGEENNWYLPNTDVYETIKPELEAHITDTFAESTMKLLAEEYFCECDFPFKPRYHPEVQFTFERPDSQTLKVEALEPPTDMYNMGSALYFELKKENDQWKMHRWDSVLLSKAPINLTQEEAALLLTSDTETPEFIETYKSDRSGGKAYLFNMKSSNGDRKVAISATTAELVFDFEME